jgi:hypothetical protein
VNGVAMGDLPFKVTALLTGGVLAGEALALLEV